MSKINIFFMSGVALALEMKGALLVLGRQRVIRL